MFKPALDNDDTIYIRDFAFTDCNDCRNYWLVREDRKSEFTNGLFLKCKGGKISANASSLFDDEIQTKLTQRCK